MASGAPDWTTTVNVTLVLPPEEGETGYVYTAYASGSAAASGTDTEDVKDVADGETFRLVHVYVICDDKYKTGLLELINEDTAETLATIPVRGSASVPLYELPIEGETTLQAKFTNDNGDATVNWYATIVYVLVTE